MITLMTFYSILYVNDDALFIIFTKKATVGEALLKVLSISTNRETRIK